MKIRLAGSAAHFGPRNRRLWPTHGPQVWPWWRLCTLSLVRLSVSRPSTGYRVWLYTRIGAMHGDVTFDRRAR